MRELRHAAAEQFLSVTKLGDEPRLVAAPEKGPAQHLGEHGLFRGSGLHGNRFIAHTCAI